MTHDSERIDEAMHERERDDDEKREIHTGSENPYRVPTKQPGEEDEVDLPEIDQDRPDEAEHRGRLRDMP